MEACTKYPPTVKAHLWKKPIGKTINSHYKWNVVTIKIHMKEKILPRARLWFICVAVCVCLCLTLCRHFPHWAAVLSHVPVCRVYRLSRGMDGFLLNVVSQPEFLCSQVCQLVTPDITRKNSTGKRHSWRSSVALRSWISLEVKYH